MAKNYLGSKRIYIRLDNNLVPIPGSVVIRAQKPAATSGIWKDFTDSIIDPCCTTTSSTTTSTTTE